MADVPRMNFKTDTKASNYPTGSEGALTVYAHITVFNKSSKYEGRDKKASGVSRIRLIQEHTAVCVRISVHGPATLTSLQSSAIWAE